MINRINLILRAKNITARQFAEEIGIQPSGMSHILGGRNNPSLEFVSKVLRRYPEIDANWLMLGRGEMYRSASAPTPPLQEPVSLPEAEENPVEASLFDEEEPVEQKPQAAEYQSSTATEEADRRVEGLFVMFSDGTFRAYKPSER